MGKVLTTVILCMVSQIGAALIARQGFAPDPIPRDQEALLSACDTLDDEHARLDCVELRALNTSGH